jgi:hypothetical protein
MKLALVTLIAVALAGSALAAAPKSATLTIRHQMKGCHSWSLDGKSWAASQKLTLTRGSRLAVVNDDVMPHKLVQLSGPEATLSHTAMTHIGATALAGFAAKGTYVFRTKAGEDYPSAKGIKTVGEDNVLKLVVTVV